MNPIENNLRPSAIARVSTAVRTAWNAGIRSWFSALPPLPQAAPPGTPARRFDFPQGANLNYFPRGEGIGFEELWALADSYPLLRLVIETRKDQLAKVPWVIRKKPQATGNQSQARAEERIQMLTEFFQSPDGENSFGDWLRALAEDLLVGDCLSLEPVGSRSNQFQIITDKPKRAEWQPAPTAGRQPALQRLLPVSGKTIFPVLDQVTGYRPQPPGIAYQQIIKGVVAAEFTADELIYRPRNRRLHKVYGFSPVEQVVLIVNAGLRYEMSRLAYFTDGTVPDAFLAVPEHWTPEQCKEVQQDLDAYLQGNVQNRRKMLVGPQGKLQILKPLELKTELDEWLARVICYAFSVSPQPFVREMNRATAESAQAAALEEGLLPLLMYFADLFNFILRKYFDAADLEFVWQEERAEDPRDQADLCAELVQNGILTPNEARARLGLAPLAGGESLQFAVRSRQPEQLAI